MCARGYRSGEIGRTASGAGGDAGQSGLFRPDLSGSLGGGSGAGLWNLAPAAPQKLRSSPSPAAGTSGEGGPGGAGRLLFCF